MTSESKRIPTTLDEEIIHAGSPAVASTQSEAERLDRVRRELVEGFERLADVAPAVSVFGSARTAPDHPEYEFARRVRARDRGSRVRDHHGGRARA